MACHDFIIKIPSRIILAGLVGAFVVWVGLAGAQPGSAQTWIQWRSTVGGNNHYYTLTPCATNWSAAQNLAVSWGGTLATITSSNEQNFINATFLTGAFEHRPLWIGLYDPSANSPVRRLEEQVGLNPRVTFRWVTGEPFSYTNWNSGEPNDYGGNEFCVTVNWHNSDNPPRGIKGDWNDAPLNGTTGFGGTTAGPYFGLVERETDPSLPPQQGVRNSVVWLGLSMILVIILMIWLARFRRHQGSAS